MDILIGILIGIFITAALSSIFSIICVIFNFNTKRLNFYTKMFLISLLTAVISFYACLIYYDLG